MKIAARGLEVHFTKMLAVCLCVLNLTPCCAPDVNAAGARGAQSVQPAPSMRPMAGARFEPEKPAITAGTPPSTRSVQTTSNAYPLLIWLKRPHAANAKKLALLTNLRYFGQASSGSLHTSVDEQQLKDIFGLQIESWTDKNAGNRIGADAHHFRIQDKRLLKPTLKTLISDIELSDDPKWGLYDEESEYRPE